MTEWPSTTQIIKDFGLINDYLENGSDLLTMHRAMQRGRLVHEACRLLAVDKDLGNGWEARHPECSPYLDAYRKFQREHYVELLAAEPEYRCEAHRFVSHPDQIVMLDQEKTPVDLELKSGSMPRWCRLQTAGQVLAGGYPLMRRYALLLKADGNYTLIPHQDFRDLDKFRAMIATWWTIQEFRTPREAA